MTRTATPPTRGPSSPGRGQPRTTNGRAGTRASTSTRPADRGQGSSAATFRRRRLTVLVVLVVVLAGAFLGVRGAVDAAHAAQETSPRIAAGPIARDAALAGEPTDWQLANPVDCRPTAVGVDVALASTTVAKGATTTFPVTVTNTGKVPCLLDVGAAQLVVTVYSGEDKIWDSRDCRGDTERRILLDVGGSDATRVTWHGVRSSDGCPDKAAKATPGSYRVIATVLDADGERITRSEAGFTIS